MCCHLRARELWLLGTESSGLEGFVLIWGEEEDGRVETDIMEVMVILRRFPNVLSSRSRKGDGFRGEWEWRVKEPL